MAAGQIPAAEASSGTELWNSSAALGFEHTVDDMLGRFADAVDVAVLVALFAGLLVGVIATQAFAREPRQNERSAQEAAARAPGDVKIVLELDATRALAKFEFAANWPKVAGIISTVGVVMKFCLR